MFAELLSQCLFWLIYATILPFFINFQITQGHSNRTTSSANWWLDNVSGGGETKPQNEPQKGI